MIFESILGFALFSGLNANENPRDGNSIVREQQPGKSSLEMLKFADGNAVYRRKRSGNRKKPRKIWESFEFLVDEIKGGITKNNGFAEEGKGKSRRRRGDTSPRNTGSSSEMKASSGNDDRRRFVVNGHNYCSKCDLAFRHDVHFEQHFLQKHPNGKPYSCRQCGMEYGRKRSLMGHMRRKHSGDVTDNSIERMRTKKGIPLRCDICDVTILGYAAFEKHVSNTHPGSEMIPCSHCDVKFYTLYEMRSHSRRTHSHSRLTCNVCNDIFDRTGALEYHEKRCDKRKMTRAKKKMGIINAEEWKAKAAEVKIPGTPGGSRRKRGNGRGKMYVCAHCGLECKGIMAYERHGIKTHPGEPMFHCEEKDCGRGFSRRKYLEYHQNSKHWYDNGMRCAYCPKCYFSHTALQDHEVVCTIKLRRKERMEKEGHPCYHCDTCDKDLYVKEESFKKHVFRHREYERCRICKDGFHRENNPNGLAAHMREKHPLDDNITALLRTVAEVDAIVAVKEENRAMKIEKRE